jgi:hypothetical protein
MGDSVLKIGPSTGTTVGFVTGTCVTSPQFRPNGTQIGTTIVCHEIADVKDLSGDSGAGVYSRAGSGTLYMAGLSWGGGSKPNGVYYDSFASWENVRMDLVRIGHRLSAAPETPYFP